MSFNEVLEELPGLTVEQRQVLIRRALELDEPPLSPDDEAVIEARLAKHREHSQAAIPLETMKSKLRSRSPQ
jgi:uncharacterized protein Smg (DUF494 family)